MPAEAGAPAPSLADAPAPTPAGVASEGELEAPPAAFEGRFELEGRGLREHTARGVVINSLFQVGFAALGLLQRFAVAAFITVSEFGLWGIVLTLLMTLYWLKEVGISDKYVQQADADQELAFQKAFTLELIYTLIWVAFVLAVLPLFALIYDRTEIILPAAVLSLSLIGSALQTPLWIAFRQMRFVRQRTLEAINPVVSTAVMVALAAAGAGYWSLVIGIVVGSFAGAAVALATCPYRIRLRLDRGTVREYLSFSGPLLVSGVCGIVVIQGMMIVGNFTVGLAGLGAIALAASLTAFADRVDAVISKTIYPAVCAVRDRTDLLFETFIKSNRLALMLGVPIGVGLFLFSPDLIEFVLGERWLPAQDLLQAMGLMVALRQVAFNWGIFFNATGNTRPHAVNGIVLAITFCLVTAPMMIAFGLDGYLIGAAASLLAELAVRAYFLRRLFAGFGMLRHLVRALLPSLPAVAAVLAVRLAVAGERSAEQALAELVLYGAVTVLATWFFERRLLAELSGYLTGARRPPATAGA